nr:hypothetical protein CFP56_03842 [Quercus suber]
MGPVFHASHFLIHDPVRFMVKMNNAPQPRRSRRHQTNRSSTCPDTTLLHRSEEVKPTDISSNAGPSSQRDLGSLATESIADDDLCPICQLLLYRPVTTQCNHSMCEACMAYWAEVSISQQVTVVDVDEVPTAFNAVSEIEAKCPMCRTPTTATLNHGMTQRLSAAYPVTWAERQVENEADGEGLANIETLTIYIGNRHRLMPPEPLEEDGRVNQFEWTFFVKPSRTDIIEEHPTFRPNRIIRERPPYEIRRLGWGTFTITAYVLLKAGFSWVSSDAEDTPDGAVKGMLPLEWDLDFAGFGGKGSMRKCKLKVKTHRESPSAEQVRDDREWRRMVRQYKRDGIYEEMEE